MTLDENMTDDTAAIAAVSVRLPSFWASKPVAWFAQVEARFIISGVTKDETKYAHLVTALDDELSTRVCDLLESPPEADRYNTLKKRLLETFSIAEEDRASRILDFGPLGSESAAERMDKLLALHPSGEKPNFLFKEVFLRQLPPHLRPHLANKEFKDFRDLARLADKLILSQPDPPTVAHVDVQAVEQKSSANQKKQSSTSLSLRPQPRSKWSSSRKKKAFHTSNFSHCSARGFSIRPHWLSFSMFFFGLF